MREGKGINPSFLYFLLYLGPSTLGDIIQVGEGHPLANIHWVIEKGKEFQKNIYFCLINYAKAFDCVDHNNLWKIQEIPDHLTCLL